jgi:small-conductance mechanosensitive channel
MERCRRRSDASLGHEGPVARRQTRGTTLTAPSLIDRMNRGEFNPAPPPPTPSGVSTIGRYKGDLVPSWLTPGLLRFLKRLPFLLILLVVLLLIAAVILFIAVGPAVGAIALVVGAVAAVASFAVRRWVQSLEAREALADGTITGDTIRTATVPASFVPPLYAAGIAGTVTPMATAATRTQAVRNFVSATANFFDNIAIVPFDPPPLKMVSFDDLRGKADGRPGPAHDDR